MKFRLLAVWIILLFAGCSKEKINVSVIYRTDPMGNLIMNAPNDNQWKNTGFTNSELALFKDMDTADLSGTSLPVIKVSGYAAPNPFSSSFMIGCSFTQAFHGDVVFKYVIVNKHMDPVKKGCLRIHADLGITFALQPDVPGGNYRLYYTFSSEGHEHFFKAWGNIQKM